MIRHALGCVAAATGLAVASCLAGHALGLGELRQAAGLTVLGLAAAAWWFYADRRATR